MSWVHRITCGFFSQSELVKTGRFRFTRPLEAAAVDEMIKRFPFLTLLRIERTEEFVRFAASARPEANAYEAAKFLAEQTGCAFSDVGERSVRKLD